MDYLFFEQYGTFSPSINELHFTLLCYYSRYSSKGDQSESLQLGVSASAAILATDTHT